MLTQSSAFCGTVIRLPSDWEASPPPWVSEWLGGASLADVTGPQDQFPVAMSVGGGISLVRVVIPDIRALDILTLQQSVADAYRAVFDHLGPAHPVRFWAFVPDIHAEMGPELDRYMAFNAGRYAAFSAWFGGREAFGRTLPTASAVGTAARDFYLYCLAVESPGTPLENPRQVPAYQYSRRFGPMPPCFARATRVDRGRESLLLVGGTASIRGEESMYVGAVGEQCEETFQNLASLIQSASGPGAAVPAHPLAPLLAFRELRVYYMRAEDVDSVLDRIKERFTSVRRVELVRAELCRRELLVEIEGLADPGLTRA
jgi:chorismate lyase/3-hydroxybenzoate synthase